ncbi:response regulator [Sphingomonas sp. 1P06PA]|uniref:hybrid sensor histidine kinase/response regulator n=1 Tax=Sphingomonas sp. 1P06PA TaxID=554121 RepID=UPI0039A73BE2
MPVASALAPAADPAARPSEAAVLAGVTTALALSIGLLWWVTGSTLVPALFAGIALCAGGIALAVSRLRVQAGAATGDADIALLAAAIADDPVATAITDRSGALICANPAYEAQFRGLPMPTAIALDGDGLDRLTAAGRAAWRDGRGEVAGLTSARQTYRATVVRAGVGEDHLVWRLARAEAITPAEGARRLVEGPGGKRMGQAGVMAALVDSEGRLTSANRVFLARALGRRDAEPGFRPFVDQLRIGEDGLVRLAAEGEDGTPLRLVQIPLDDAGTGVALFLMLDEAPHVALSAATGAPATANVHALLAMLPLGLALSDRDGRFLFMNDAFCRAAGLQSGQSAVYPSDLVVREDKGAVADAIRRFSAGRAHSGDLSIRLASRPEEPVALTIAGAKGLGEASVLLSLKDNSEESRLKKQVAQATKMQAVGQLAGGVAHDFNNILTAILGYCELMLMRHTPGDSDYDDIQQIRHNSNRAAALTRQLLAFSRQQTLRPQVLQLPDVISEISNLLKRLLGETVTLTVKHGRNLGAIRADPGQLEQVIVNLAVNARDAMPNGGTLTLQTYSVSAAQVRKIGSDILPVADYTALSVSDTGTGIPAEILPKVFEPFFTTKEVGKGTGLGLSTVYGIVKQTGGFIFADSQPGEGTSFTIYLPVHLADPKAEPAPKAAKEPAGLLWGTGTILLVEDEDMVRAVAERALSRQGYQVLTAENGERALEMLEQGASIDLLISDVVMPAMDGPTLVRHARERNPALPILFMSGYAEEQLRRSIDIDNVAFLAKPFSVQQLGAAARDALAAKRP